MMRAEIGAGGVEMKIEVGEFAGPGRVRAQAVRRLQAVLARVPARSLAARLSLTDENGPKGGQDLRCAVTVNIPRRAVIRVAHVADAPALALARTFEMLERRLERERERRRENRRRPKKYYAARRVLFEGEAIA